MFGQQVWSYIQDTPVKSYKMAPVEDGFSGSFNISKVIYSEGFIPPLSQEKLKESPLSCSSGFICLWTMTLCLICFFHVIKKRNDKKATIWVSRVVLVWNYFFAHMLVSSCTFMGQITLRPTNKITALSHNWTIKLHIFCRFTLDQRHWTENCWWVDKLLFVKRVRQWGIVKGKVAISFAVYIFTFLFLFKQKTHNVLNSQFATGWPPASTLSAELK